MLAKHLYEYVTHYDLKTKHGHHHGVDWMEDVAIIYFKQWWKKSITIKCGRRIITKNKEEYWVPAPEFLTLREKLTKTINPEEEKKDD